MLFIALRAKTEKSINSRTYLFRTKLGKVKCFQIFLKSRIVQNFGSLYNDTYTLDTKSINQ
jgi:hypothetical protein